MAGKRVKATGNEPRRVRGRGLSVIMSGDLAAGAEVTSRSCVICGPARDCDCHTVKFGSDEYFARMDRAHGRS
jgi:hypothetical protein